MIEANADKMHAMVDALMKWETIDRDQLLSIMAGEEPRPPRDYQAEAKQQQTTTSSSLSTPPPLPAM